MKASMRMRLAASILLVASTAMVSRAQDAFGTLTSPHFDVRYQQGVAPEDARKVHEFLLSELKNQSADLGIDYKGKIEVRIYESVGKFLAETNLKRPWRTALYTRGVLSVQPVAALSARKLFEKSLSYELAHALLEQASQNGCPQWLIESFAVYYSGEVSGMTPPLGAKLSAFSDLNQDIQ